MKINKLINVLKKLFGRILFWGFFLLSCYAILAIKIFPQLCFYSSIFEDKQKDINDILFNLSIGYIVSTIFYYIVSYLPDKKRKKDALMRIDSDLNGIVNTMYYSLEYLHFKMKVNKNFENLEINDFKKIHEIKSIPMNFSCRIKNNGKWMNSNGQYEIEIDRFNNEFERLPKLINNIISINFVTIDLDKSLLDVLISIRDCQLYRLLKFSKEMYYDFDEHIFGEEFHKALFDYYEKFKELKIYKKPDEISF